MQTQTPRTPTVTEPRRFPAPPLPHEHGAWVMLYVPMAVAFAVAHFIAPVPAFLLFLALTGAFLARHPADLLLRGRAQPGALLWTGVYLAVAALGGLPLLLVYQRGALLVVLCIAGALFGAHVALLTWPSRKRLDRSVAGEVLAVAGLTLSAPAAYVVATGQLDGMAWCLWAACALFFGGGVFHVKMLLGAAKHRGAMDLGARLSLGRFNLAYHAAMAGVAVALSGRAGAGAAMVCLAYAPAVARAVWGTLRLSRRLPPLKRVGVLETLYALWFAVLFASAVIK